MGGLQPWHWLILAIVVIVLFGSKRLPDAARSLGKSLRIFKSEVREMQSENRPDTPPQPPAPPAVAPTPVQAQRVDPAEGAEQGQDQARRA
ncbi:Sec-independent protein translocase subunit TatA [Mycobacterium sp.]|uniref:Sec-independent protein translocase subunit TatA n=1 Tax=Mycobacterium sp. TaxID=1785 RepID=UPI003A89C172